RSPIAALRLAGTLADQELSLADSPTVALRASQVRETLLKKQEKVVSLLKALCARVPRKMMTAVTAKFVEIEKVLRAKTSCLEDVDEQRKYIEALPNKVMELMLEIEASKPWYEQLETLRHLLPEDEARDKFTGEAWPAKLQRLAERQLAVLEEDESKYKEEMSSEQDSFAGQVVSLANQVSSFAHHTDLTKMNTILGEVRVADRETHMHTRLWAVYQVAAGIASKQSVHGQQTGLLCRDWPAQPSPVQPSATQHSTVQHGTARHSMVPLRLNGYHRLLTSAWSLAALLCLCADIWQLVVDPQARALEAHLKQADADANTFNGREALLGVPLTDYSGVRKLVEQYEPFCQFWTVAAAWRSNFQSWMNDSWEKLDGEVVEREVVNAYKVMFKTGKVLSQRGLDKNSENCEVIRQEVEGFKPYVPLIQALRNPGMRPRHWDQLSAQLGFHFHPDKNFTIKKAQSMNLLRHIDVISRVADVAGKEYSIEKALEKMQREWEAAELQVLDYRESKTYIIKVEDAVSQQLDDHIVMTQSMTFSPYKKPFE
ncbi:hypothetical protein QJQ45_021839, partial [Haematococcus lacustris]